MAKMTESELKAFIGQQVNQSQSWMKSISSERAKNLRDYLGEPLGNEVEGLSQAISSDTQDIVEALLPDLMEIFGGSDRAVQYEPVEESDEDFAEEATDYVNDVVWYQDNDGFKITYDAIKDVLLEKNATFAVFWDDPEYETETVIMNQVQIAELTMGLDENTEILEVELQGEEEAIDEEVGPLALFDVTIKRMVTPGKCVVDVVPSEEFGVSSRDRELDETALFPHVRKSWTASELIEAGYPKELVDELPSDEGDITIDKRQTRRARLSDQETTLTLDSSNTRATRQIMVTDAYPLLDYDGEGVAKRYFVRSAGIDASHILPDPETGELAVEVPYHPYVNMNGIRQPHRYFGLAVADLCREIMRQKSTVTRQLLDNMTNANNARTGVSNRVDLEDYLANQAGGVVGVDTDAPDVAGHFFPIPTQSLAPMAIPTLEYLDGRLEKRTGVYQNATPTDANALHRTAGGANLVLGQVQKRMLLIARVICATGFVDVFRKILRVVTDNQDFARSVRLRGQWTTVDPRNWNPDMEVRAVAGLGSGTRQDRLNALTGVMGLQREFIAQQGGLNGPFITSREVYNTLERYIADSGLGDVSLYFREPQPQETQQEEGPSAEEVQAQEEMALERAKAENEMAIDRAKAQNDMALNTVKAQQEYLLAVAKGDAQYDLAMLDQIADMQLKAVELAEEAVLERRKMAMGDPAGQGNIPTVVQ